MLYDLIYILYHAKLPGLIWGQPGIGKTSILKKLAEDLGVNIEVLIASIHESSDFSGLPKINKDSNTFSFVPPHFVTKFQNGKGQVIKEDKNKHQVKSEQGDGGILFFDEITTCPPNIQSALLNIILEKKIGEEELDPETFVIAAGNYLDTVGTHSVSEALMNRFVHIFANVDVSSFCTGIVNGFLPEKTAVLTNPEDRLNKVAFYRDAVSVFIKSNPDLLFTKPEVMTDENVAYATPRTWEYAIKLLSVIDIEQTNEQITKTLLAGTIGKAVGDVFYKFACKHKIIFDPLQYLGKEDQFKYPREIIDSHSDVDRVLGSMYFYLQNSDTNDHKYVKLTCKAMTEAINNNYECLVAKYLSKVIDILINKGVPFGTTKGMAEGTFTIMSAFPEAGTLANLTNSLQSKSS